MKFFVDECESYRCTSSVSMSCPYCYDEREKIEIRKTGNRVIFMPDFESWYAVGSVWYMTKKKYEQIRKIVSEFPSFDVVPLLTKHDCARIFLDELPDSMVFILSPEGDLNFYPAESTQKDIKDLYLNTDAPEKEKIVNILQNVVKECLDSQEPVKLKPVSQKKSVTVILDTPDYFEWQPLYKFDGGYCLQLKPGYKVMNKLPLHA